MAKGKISCTLQRPNGHTTRLSTSEPLTEEVVREAERFIDYLTTGKTSGAVVRAAIELDVADHVAKWLFVQNGVSVARLRELSDAIKAGEWRKQ